MIMTIMNDLTLPHRQQPTNEQHTYDCLYRQMVIYCLINDKFMQTPFQKIRRREKERKQKINLSISPNHQNFSLESSPRSSLCGSLRRTKHHSTKTRPDISKTAERIKDRGQYQLLVRDSLRKTSNHRFATPTGKQQEMASSMEQSRNLAIEGLKCGDDLIKQNRGKLEYMIAQITANAKTVLHIDQPLQEICMEKYRAIRSRIDRDQQCRIEKRMQSTSLTKKTKFDTREFLICQPLQLEQDTVRTPKPIKRSSNATRKLNLTYKDPEPVFNFLPDKFYLDSPRKKTLSKSCKTEQIANPSSPCLTPAKAAPKLNTFNPLQLRGWQSHSQQTQQPLFLVPNFY